MINKTMYKNLYWKLDASSRPSRGLVSSIKIQHLIVKQISDEVCFGMILIQFLYLNSIYKKLYGAAKWSLHLKLYKNLFFSIYGINISL